MPTTLGRLEEQDRDQLLHTARRLLAEADALSTRIAAVNEIGIAINSTLDLNAILRVVGKQAKWLLDFDYCSVCLAESTPDSWRIVTLFGTPESDPANLLATENVGRALRTAQPQTIQNSSPSPFMAGYASQVIIPLVADSIVLGTINFATTKAQCYTQDDMRIGYMLALQLASAIRNARNFAELAHARDELQRYATELEARNQELDAYSHTIAHDLKAPLSIIVLKSDLLRAKFKTDLPDDAHSTLATIKDSTMKMSHMIDQLLWLARLRNVQETVKEVEMTLVIDAALARFLPQLDARKIVVEIMPNIPIAWGHTQWIEEIFANLISNAIKYMGENNPNPRITIAYSCTAGAVRYEVRDTGVGISPEDQARLFTMFTRLHTVKAEGLGLGLSIVHRIVTKLGGTLGVESQLGQGSTFWFTLPTLQTVEQK